MAQIPITPNQQGKCEMRDEVRASAGAQYMDTSGYELWDLEDIDFFWEIPQMDIAAVFRPAIDTPFSPRNLDDFDLRGSSGNPIVLYEKED